MRNAAHLTYKVARRITVAVVGVTVLLIGLLMIVTPGPAIIVIPVGLAILSLEFAWARHWLKRMRETISSQNSKDHDRRIEEHRRRI
ncbi:MAG: PGPGW domain-containing protein [Gammaproteobacteria bacterium]|nr:PGPGW domain-containing protein [Gammaproteobacteria bacterium]